MKLLIPLAPLEKECVKNSTLLIPNVMQTNANLYHLVKEIFIQSSSVRATQEFERYFRMKSRDTH